MKKLDMLTRILVIVGGLNWGLVGIAKFDLVATLFGAGSALSTVVYVLVGVSAVVQFGRLLSPEASSMRTASL